MYEVGTKLKFRTDLEVDKIYGGFTFQENMYDFAQNYPIVTIANYDEDDDTLRVDEDEEKYWYHITMFQKITNLTKINKDTLFDMMLNNEISEEQYEKEINKKEKKT